MGRGWRRHEWSQPVEGVRMNGINGLDVEALKAFAAQILANPEKGRAGYAVKTTWNGQLPFCDGRR